MIPAVYRNARYEQRIAALEAQLADVHEAMVNIGNLGVATAQQLGALCVRLSEQSEMLPGEYAPTMRGMAVN